MTTPSLFDSGDLAIAHEPVVNHDLGPGVRPAGPGRDRDQFGRSADERRTARQRADAAAGRNPLTRGPIRQPAGETCGSCRWRVTFHHHNRTYPKCNIDDGVRITSGAASDVRAWWPACTRWEPKP